MHSSPFAGIDSDIESVLRELILPTDNYHQNHKRRMARTLQVLKDNKPKGRLLELGGSGVFTLAAKELFPDLEVEVTNFDSSQSLVHEFCPSMGKKYACFKAYNIDLETDSIPAENDSYDWVTCCEVIEHMEIDPMAMMWEINRVVKRGGSLLLTTPNVVSSRGIAKMLAGVEPYFYMQYRHDRSFYRHNYEYSIHSLMQVVQASGFDGSIWTEDCFEDGMPGPVNKLKKAGFEVNHVGDNIFVMAEKVGPVKDRHPRAIYAD